MKFGKRRRDPEAGSEQPGTVPVAGSNVSPERVTDSWTLPVADAPPVAAEAVPAAEQAHADEPVVEGDAVELPAEAPLAYELPVTPPAEAPLAYEPPVAPPFAPPPADPMPFPVADEPVAVVPPDPLSAAAPAPVIPLGDSAAAYASGHPDAGAAPGPAWQEPVVQLANERPEVVVGAAFAGGILAAMILRRLGN